MSCIRDWYNDFSDQQKETGITLRNLRIQQWAEKFGLLPHHKVLEIGCGIGTQTQLLAEYLQTPNNIVANDISDKSIKMARERLKGFQGINFIADDFMNVNLDEKFDMIILPDVIEHIPLEQHLKLFEKIQKHLKSDGFILIHIPNPYYLEWCHENMKETLQIIDQPIYTDELVKNLYPHGLYIHHLETYSIWMTNCDYQVILVKKTRRDLEYRRIVIPVKKSIFQKVKGKIKSIISKD